MGDRTCSESDCVRAVLARGWCAMHYQRWLRDNPDLVWTGLTPPVPLAGERHGLWTGDEATYTAVHQRLAATRGKASSHPCSHCGGPAVHWAYDHRDPNERTGHTGRKEGPYSTDLARYFPLCILCHRRFDAAWHLAQPTTCRRGLHPFPENRMFIGAARNACCKKCRADYRRTQYRAKKAKKDV